MNSHLIFYHGNSVKILIITGYTSPDVIQWLHHMRIFTEDRSNEKDPIRLPWQQSMDLKISLEPEGLFGICASNLHHVYTTHFVTIF